MTFARLGPNKPDAANPAIASRFHGRCPWRGVADTGRSAAMQHFDDLFTNV